VGGLRDCKEGGVVDAAAQYPKAFAFCASHPGSVLLVFDLQTLVKNAGIYRSLKDCFPALKANGSMVVLVAPVWSLPAELAHDLPVLQFALPTREELGAALGVVVKSLGDKAGEFDAAALLDAGAGLTLQEAENSFALARIESGRLDPAMVEREKMRLVRSSGFLEVSQAADPADVGGLQALKDYITQEVIPSKGDDKLRVRGLLLVGVPGTGKSLASRAAGSLLGWPVVRLDFGALKAGLVGQSESNLRGALKLADAIAPCVLWIDEIEKGVGGFASSAQSDGGTTLAMVGALLVWMAEHTSAVIVVATCNDYRKLPAELTRAGRFDERFFVDLPSGAERFEIADVHLRKYADMLNHALCSLIADISDGWTGAEIEQLIKSAARRGGKAITPDLIPLCARDIKPISRVRADEITALRDWARESLRIANTVEVQAEGRKVTI
jgi:hypothetical protein